MEKKLAVVALGGNAILRGNQKGTVAEQNQNIRETLENLVYLIRDGYNLIITHGNGPQVGNILMSDDAGVKMYGLPPMPLDMCVAYSQGQIGYMIERNLRNILREHNLSRHVVSMISQVVVDQHDPALQNPTKRVGKIYNKEEADQLSAEHGWIFKEEIKVEGGWRHAHCGVKVLHCGVLKMQHWWNEWHVRGVLSLLVVAVEFLYILMKRECYSP